MAVISNIWGSLFSNFGGLLMTNFSNFDRGPISFSGGA